MAPLNFISLFIVIAKMLNPGNNILRQKIERFLLLSLLLCYQCTFLLHPKIYPLMSKANALGCTSAHTDTQNERFMWISTLFSTKWWYKVEPYIAQEISSICFDFLYTLRIHSKIQITVIISLKWANVRTATKRNKNTMQTNSWKAKSHLKKVTFLFPFLCGLCDEKLTFVVNAFLPKI